MSAPNNKNIGDPGHAAFNRLKTKLPEMKIHELQLVEYKLVKSSAWHKMFNTVLNQFGTSLKCVLCKTNLISGKAAISQHLKGKKHQKIYQNIELLYHPLFTPGGKDNETKIKNEGNSLQMKQLRVHIDQKPFKDLQKFVSQKDFKSKISKLTIPDLILIEYKMENTKWCKMFNISTNRPPSYQCLMCNTNQMGDLSCLRQHMAGKKHCINQESALFYHPELVSNLKQFTDAFDDPPNESSEEVANQNLGSVDLTSEVTTADNKETTECTTISVKNEKNDAFEAPVKSEQQEKTDESDKCLQQGKKDDLDKFQQQRKRNVSDKCQQQEKKEELDKFQQQRKKNELDKFQQQQKRYESDKCKQEEKGGGSDKYQQQNISDDSDKDKVRKTVSETDKENQTVKDDTDNKNTEVIVIEGNNNEDTDCIVLEKSNATSFVIDDDEEMKQVSLDDDKITTLENLQPILIESDQKDEEDKTGHTAKKVSNKKVINPIALFAKQNLNKEKTSSVPNETSIKNNKIKLPLFLSSIQKNDPKREIQGLIGVEYVIQTYQYNSDTNWNFECALCEVESDSIGMEWHLKGLSHRLKYLEKHFPTCINQHEQYKTDLTKKPILSKIVEKIAFAVDRYHGKRMPYKCPESEYTKNRHQVMAKVFAYRHASEYSGPSFTNVVDKKTLDDILNGIDATGTEEICIPERKDIKRKTEPSKDKPIYGKRNKPDTSHTLDNEEHKKLVDEFLKTNRESFGRHRRQSRSPNSRARRTRRSLSRSRSRDRSFKNRQKSPLFYNNDLWKKYNYMLNDALSDIDIDYEKYNKHPESHPLYAEEWNLFWEKRCDELLQVGKDPTLYNFQPEWILFWTQRMKKIYLEDIENIKEKLKIQLGLPLTRSENTQSKVTQPTFGIAPWQRPQQHQMEQHQMQPVQMQPAQMQSVHMQPARMQPSQMQPAQMQQGQMQQAQMQQAQMQPMQMSQQHQMQLPHMHMPNNERFYTGYNAQSNYQNQNHNRPDRSLRFSEKNYSTVQEKDVSGYASKFYRNPSPSRTTDNSDNERKSRGMSSKVDDDENEIDTGPLTTVSVLRLLTALEDLLGSLGPKVIDLLTKALALEKVKANSSDEALLTEDNCVFLETVKEKLRGQLIADVLDKNKIRAVKRGIKDVQSLLEQKDEEQKTKINISSPNQGMGLTEKQHLAMKLASTLATHGKADMVDNQLEQFVNIYSILEKKQDSGDRKSLADTLADLMKINAKQNTIQQDNVTDIQSRTETFERQSMVQTQSKPVWQNMSGGNINIKTSTVVSQNYNESINREIDKSVYTSQHAIQQKYSTVPNKLNSAENNRPLGNTSATSGNMSNRSETRKLPSLLDQQITNPLLRVSASNFFDNSSRTQNTNSNSPSMVSYPNVWNRDANVNQKYTSNKTQDKSFGRW